MNDSVVDVLIYSADSARRQAVIEGCGIRPGKNSPRLNWIEAATSAGTLMKVTDRKPVVAVLDADAPKVGGMAVAQDILNELDFQPIIVLLIARPQDQWLANWSGAKFTVLAPYDPLELQETMVEAIAAAG